jgi:uncharacterized repeat protein (TIGR03803 family)
MKKLSLLATLIVALFTGHVKAQSYVFYGTTISGGTNASGTLYEYNPATGTDSILHNFNFGQGASPYATVVLDTANGLYYGVTPGGGPTNLAVIYSYNPVTGQYNNVYDLKDSEGALYAQLTYDAYYNGSFYGTTYQGGAYLSGSIFSFNPATNQFKTLLSFDDTTGGAYGPASIRYLTQANGMFYGTTLYGGSGNGTLYSFNPVTNKDSVLLAFNGTNGSQPVGYPLVYDNKNGILYGTTQNGGSNNYGEIFSYTINTGQQNVVHNFSGADGVQPEGIIYDSVSGLIYGVSTYGGDSGMGAIFSFNPATNTEKVLYSMGNVVKISNNLLTLGPCGVLYWVAGQNGAHNAGTIYSLNPVTGQAKLEYTFTSTPDGNFPNSNLTLVQAGGPRNAPLPRGPQLTLTSSGNTICPGSSATLTASGAVSYVWSNGATTSSVNVSPTDTTVYSVIGTGSNGCASKRCDTVKVGNGQLTISVTPTNATINPGNTAMLTASGATTYSWAPAAGLNTTNGAAIIATPTITTTYTVTGSNGSCTGQQTVVVTVQTGPIFITPAAGATCTGSPITLSATGGKNYAWSTGHNGPNLTVSPTVTTTYTVTGIVNKVSVSQTVVVTVNPLPTIAIASSQNLICKGTSAILSASGASTYKWSTGSTNDTIIVSPNTSHNYKVTGTDINGCVSQVSDSVTVNNCGPGYSCSKAIKLPLTPVSIIDSVYPHSTKWYTFTADSSVDYIKINDLSVNTATIQNISVYTSCGGTLIAQGLVNTPLQDSIIIHDSTLVKGNTYYIAVSAPACNFCTNQVAYKLNIFNTVHMVQVVPFNIYPNPITGCGVNYVVGDVAIHGRTEGGCPGNGATGTSGTITIPAGSVPQGASIQKAYLVWTVVGLAAGATGAAGQSFIFQNTAGTIYNSTTSGIVIAQTGAPLNNNSTAWGGNTVYFHNNPWSAGYIADVTTLINFANPNGNYVISGLPYYTAANPSPDADGATLIIVYQDPCASYTGTFTLATGFDSQNSNQTYSINLAPAAAPGASGSAFFIAGDFENCSGIDQWGINSTLATNAFPGGANSQANLWSTLSQPFVYNATGQNIVNFVINAAGDWYDMVALGAYWSVPNATICYPLTVTANPSIICSGSSTILTASTPNPIPNIVYTWSPVIGLSSSTGNSVTATPANTTAYVVQGSVNGVNIPCQTYTIVVTVNQTPALTVNSTNICGGSAGTASVSVTGGTAPYTYLWSSGQTTSSISVTSPGTYTVTVASSNSCSNTATVTIGSYGLPTLPPSSYTTCSGACVQIGIVPLPPPNLNPPFSYVWSPATGLSCTNCPDPISCPTGTTVYNVIVTNYFTGCTNSGSVTVTVNQNCCTVNCTATVTGSSNSINYNGGLSIPTGTSSSSYVGTPVTFTGCTSSTNSITLNIQGIFNITGVCTIDNCNVAMSPNSQIIVQSGATLNIDNARLFACTTMWQGILVLPGGRINVINNSIIEDAQIGIEGQALGSFAAITVQNSKLNNNHIDIELTGSGNFQLTLQGDILTTGVDPGFSGATLKAPYSGMITYSGIYILNTSGAVVSVGDPSLASYLNNFSNMNYGVNVINSTFEVYNNKFSNLQGYSSSCHPIFGGPPCPYPIGIAVLANTSIRALNNSAIIGGSAANQKNIMIDCYRGVDITGYYINTVLNNILWNSTNNPQKKGIVILGPNLFGDHGVFIKGTTYTGLEVNNNRIVNYTNAIHVLGAAPGFFNTATADVNGNDIYITNGTNASMTYGILAENIYSTPGPVANGQFNVNSNTVDSAIICIGLSGIRNMLTYVTDNTKLLILPSKANNLTKKAGISITNFTAANTLGALYQGLVDHNENIYSTGTVLSAHPNYADTNVVGIYTVLSTGIQVVCNTIYDVGQCIRFDGYCNNSAFGNNTLTIGTNTKCFDGLVLESNGIIGTNGNSTTGCWDTWSSNANFLRSETYTFKSNPANSLLYVTGLPGTQTNPKTILNKTNGTYLAYSYPTTILHATGTEHACTDPLTPLPAHRSIHQSISDSIANLQLQMDRIVEDSITYYEFIPETQYLNKQGVYNIICNDSSIMSGDTVLQNFYNRTKATNMANINAVELQSEQSNYTLAQSLNNSIIPQCVIEQNHKDVKSIFFSTLANGVDSLDSTQINTLWNIAKQCPFEGGRAVYEARYMLNYFYNTAIAFEDSCSGQGQSDKPVKKPVLNKIINAAVYPNPANSLLTVELDLQPNETGFICIYNSMGEQVRCETLKNNITTLPISDLSMGIYYYRITDLDDNLIKSDKVMIIH